MDAEKKLEAMFMTTLDAKWLMKERFCNGLKTLFNEANTDDELEVVKHVLKTLTYCQSEDLVQAGAEAARQIEDVWKLSPRDTIIVGVAKQGQTCGSTAYVRCIENSLPRGWSSEKSIWTTIDSAFQERNDRVNLVVVDDFVGTGEKLASLFERLRKSSNTSTYIVHACTFAAMECGRNHLDEALDQRFIAHLVLQKCISDLLQEPQRSAMLSAMVSLEGKIFSKPSEYSLGYKKSEASFYLESFNIPNNTFPVLWKDTYANRAQRAALFSRR
jgi:hypothetical protein